MKNGYAPSLCPTEYCLVCGRTDRALQRHEVFHGAYRQKSKRLGCWVLLCYACHNEVHNGHDGLDLRLKRFMQKKAMTAYRWDTEQFRQHFGKKYEEVES